MPGHRYLWATLIITLFISCIHFGRKDPFIEGISNFRAGRLKDAREKFLTAVARGDSIEPARRYLIKIYRLEGKERQAKDQCLLMLRSGIVKLDIIKFLNKYYTKCGDYHNLYLVLKIGAFKIPEIGGQIVDRRLLSTLFTGLLTKKRRISDPINWVIKRGFLKPMPDGNFYPHDTVLIENLAVVLAPYLPSVDRYQVSDNPFEYSLAKLDRFGLASLIRPSNQSLKLKDAITILDRVKGYLR